MTLSLGTWAIAPLAVVLREHTKAETVRLTLLRDGPTTERVHVEAIYSNGRCEETTVHEVAAQGWIEGNADDGRCDCSEQADEILRQGAC